MKKILIFDIDNTLTPPRKPLNRTMADILKKLAIPFHVAAGSDLDIVRDQLFEPLHGYGYRGVFDAFLCNGATRYRCHFNQILSVETVRNFNFRSYLGEDNYLFLLETLMDTLADSEFQLPDTVEIIGDQVINRGAMLNVAPIGRPEVRLSEKAYMNRTAFAAFDKRTGYRRKLLAHFHTRLKHMLSEKNLIITLGGETSFDFNIKGNDKSYALAALLEEGFEHITYCGDALFQGGNDWAVMQYIREWPESLPCPVEAVQVSGWEETRTWLQSNGYIDIVNDDSLIA